MNTFGLGRYVNTFGLGRPYAGEIPEPEVEREQGGRQFYEEKTELELLRERQLQELIMREDEEITEFLRTLLSKGLI